eukprot:2939539-Rhodomonas_salina.2
MILIRMNENPGTGVHPKPNATKLMKCAMRFMACNMRMRCAGYRWQLVTDDKDGFDQSLCQLQPTSGLPLPSSSLVSRNERGRVGSGRRGEEGMVQKGSIRVGGSKEG